MSCRSMLSILFWFLQIRHLLFTASILLLVSAIPLWKYELINCCRLDSECLPDLQILKLHNHHDSIEIKNFKFKMGDCDPCLKLIIPESTPYLTKVQPEDGMVWQHSECMIILESDNYNNSSFISNRLKLLTFGGIVSMKIYRITVISW